MDNIGIFKAAYYMNNSIYLTDVCKELVSESLSLDAPFTSPAMSTNSITAGVTFFDL